MRSARSTGQTDRLSSLSRRLSMQISSYARHNSHSHYVDEGEGVSATGRMPLTIAMALCPAVLKCNNPIRGRRLPTCKDDAEGSTPAYKHRGDVTCCLRAGLRASAFLSQEDGVPRGENILCQGSDKPPRLELINHIPLGYRTGTGARTRCRRCGSAPCMTHADLQSCNETTKGRRSGH